MKNMYEQLENYMWEILADLNAPVTDDLLVEYMEDSERVQEAYDVMLSMIKGHFYKEFDLEWLNREEQQQ